MFYKNDHFSNFDKNNPQIDSIRLIFHTLRTLRKINGLNVFLKRKKNIFKLLKHFPELIF